MIAEISSLISSSKAAYDIAKGVNALKSEVDRNEAISIILKVLLSVQSDALSVQSKTHELAIEKHNLTKKLMEFEKWSETEQQYELKEVIRGVFVYSYKKENEISQPMHWLCTNCWKDKVKSILQRTASDDTYTCPKCKTEINLSMDTFVDFACGSTDSEW